MSLIVRDLPPLKTFTSSGGATGVSFGIGHLDDASSITLFQASSATSLITAVQVSQVDPADPFPQVGVTQSSGWVTISSGATSSATSITLTNISFRGLRLGLTTSSSQAGEIAAFASKQISV